MPRRVLITGGSGFVGQWLSKLCLEHGARVFGGTIEGPPPEGVLTPAARKAVTWIPLDTSSADSVDRAVSEAAPEFVVHLAGIAFPPDANANPARAYDVNTLGAARLLLALAGQRANLRVLVVGTAEQYGRHADSEYPLDESIPQFPHSPYAGSKAAQEILALQISRSSSIEVIGTRSFNHSGVGHGQSYLLPSLVRRAKQLPPRGGSLAMGNTSPIRDYLHVADVVNAYWLLLERGHAGDIYNVSSGRGISVREIGERVLQRLGVSASIVEDPALARASDVPILVGDNSKIRRATGWTPERTIDDIIDDLIHASTS